MNEPLSIWERDGAVFLKIHLQPRAARNEVAGIQGDSLKIRLTSPPLENRANRHLQDFLADLLGCPKAAVGIAAGTKSRHKTVSVCGFSAREILDRLTQHLVD